ncbi:MAG: ABC transporter ATP-binding protein [Candidatus Omnitrophica bacterium]|nr:ABC transporter ATP-binding protein [Candidatus Omnitrophota bacterium]
MTDNTTKNVVLEATNITKNFGELPVLENLSFSLNKNEFVSLVGPSGCGKTTCLRILAGLTKSFSGNIQYRLGDISTLPCSLVFQDSPLFPWLTVVDNIKICLNFGYEDLNKKEKHTLALDYLIQVGLHDFIDYYPYELSGGMIQRVNIARALASGSEIILMDEPFVHLDFLQRNDLQKLTLNLLKKQCKSIFFITHNIHEAVTLSDRVFIMSARPGNIIKELSVNLPRPRNIDTIRSNQQYQSLIREISELLSAELKKSHVQFEQWLLKKNQNI